MSLRSVSTLGNGASASAMTDAALAALMGESEKWMGEKGRDESRCAPPTRTPAVEEGVKVF